MTAEQPLKVLFGSLKHVTAGRHSAFMPVAIGFIAAYAVQELGGDAIDVVLEEDPNEALRLIEEWRPDVVALSHYCWNAEINYVVMRKAQAILGDDVVCVAGGPEFHEEPEDCLQMLRQHPEVDFFAFGEGETPFVALARQITAGAGKADLRRATQLGFMSVHPDTQTLISGERPIREKEMDFIPSPYLSGVMDHFFDGEHAPMVQLARGCPYACTFCNAAQTWYNRVAAFSPERVRAELDYIAEKTQNYPELPLAITDSNFGMFKRDVDIAEHIRRLQDEYGWPIAFDFTTGKAHHDRILHVNDTMRNTAHILLALQSTNDLTLDVVKRKNLSNETFQLLHKEIKSRGMLSATDLIIPLPEETKDSFLTGLQMVTDEGVDLIVSNTLCLLKGTGLNSRETRETYDMQTKWRLVPRQYGCYDDQVVFDMEEVCIATNTMPFEDYLECRGIGGVAIVFSDPQFNIVHRHVRELGVSKFDLVLRIWERLSSGRSEISPLYETFLSQSESELFDSEQAAIEFYSTPENQRRLKTGEIGDNLIRRFRASIFLHKAIPALELAYDCLEELVREKISSEHLAALRSARAWSIRVRDVSAVFADDGHADMSETLEMAFDVPSWYEAGPESPPLIDFAGAVTYDISLGMQRVQGILDSGYRMYGHDKSLAVPRILEYHDISNFWFDSSAAGTGAKVN